MALAREAIRVHADADHYGLGEVRHANHLVTDTGEPDKCNMPYDLCPHVQNDPPIEPQAPTQDEPPPNAMSTDSQFKRIIVYVPVEVAISEDLASEDDHMERVSGMLHQVISDQLLEPESVAEHDPFAIVGVSTKYHHQENTEVWERVLPDPKHGVYGTVAQASDRVVDFGNNLTIATEFGHISNYLQQQIKDGKIDGLTRVRLVLELQVPEREPENG